MDEKTTRRRRRQPDNFYAIGSLPEARVEPPADLNATLAQIAIMRARILKRLHERQHDPRLFLQAIDTLVRTLVAEHHLTGGDDVKARAQKFWDAVAAIQAQFLPDGQPPYILPPDN